MFTVLSKPNCGHCVNTKEALKFKKLAYEEILHDTEDKIEAFKARGFRTFPQVFYNEIHIGGNDQLQMYLMDNF